MTTRTRGGEIINSTLRPAYTFPFFHCPNHNLYPRCPDATANRENSAIWPENYNRIVMCYNVIRLKMHSREGYNPNRRFRRMFDRIVESRFSLQAVFCCRLTLTKPIPFLSCGSTSVNVRSGTFPSKTGPERSTGQTHTVTPGER